MSGSTKHRSSERVRLCLNSGFFRRSRSHTNSSVSEKSAMRSAREKRVRLKLFAACVCGSEKRAVYSGVVNCGVDAE